MSYENNEAWSLIWHRYGYKLPRMSWRYPGVAKYAPRDDCFAYRNTPGNEGCGALKQTFCKYGNCHFYKTRKEVKGNDIEYLG